VVKLGTSPSTDERRKSCAIWVGVQKLVDSVDAIIWKGDASLQVYFRHQAEVVLGYPVEALDGGTSFWHIHPSRRP